LSASRTVGLEWAGRYEALRAHATGEAPLDWVPLGLSILRHRGVAAWMDAESSATESERAERPPGSRERGSRPEFDVRRSELALLLAGTALRAAQRRAR